MIVWNRKPVPPASAFLMPDNEYRDDALGLLGLQVSIWSVEQQADDAVLHFLNRE